MHNHVPFPHNRHVNIWIFLVVWPLDIPKIRINTPKYKDVPIIGKADGVKVQEEANGNQKQHYQSTEDIRERNNIPIIFKIASKQKKEDSLRRRHERKYFSMGSQG